VASAGPHIVGDSNNKASHYLAQQQSEAAFVAAFFCDARQTQRAPTVLTW
jgi:hypothetical protein